MAGTNSPSEVKNGQPQGSFIHRNLVSAYKTSPIMLYQVCRIVSSTNYIVIGEKRIQVYWFDLITNLLLLEDQTTIYYLGL